MRVTYDAEAQAIYIKFFDGDHGKCEELIDGITLDKTPLGQIYGMEILGIDRIEFIEGLNNG